jgi:hypothetical protein
MRLVVLQCLSRGFSLNKVFGTRCKNNTALNRTNNRHINEQTAFVSPAVTAAGRVMTAISRHAVAGFLGIVVLYLSMVTTSAPMRSSDRQAVERAIALLESKGFDRDATLLRTAATFRASDNWLNTHIVPHENAYASTNFPVGIITLYEDFYKKAVDDTERAVILLHEAQHLKGGDEHAAYAYVWQHRSEVGWTILRYGTTESYITIEDQTRAEAPELFTCQERLYNDCTEQMNIGKWKTESAKP